MEDDDFKKVNTSNDGLIRDDGVDEKDETHLRKMWLIFAQAVPSIFCMMLWVFSQTV